VVGVSEIVFRRKASVDIDDIWKYTAGHWDIDQADQYIQRIVETCRKLAQGSLHGRDLAYIRPGYLSYPVQSHTLIYLLPRIGQIEVVRILHQRMDPGRHL
jgi:toxin ParE1/3/4